MTTIRTTPRSFRRGREPSSLFQTDEGHSTQALKLFLPDLPPEILFVVFEFLPDEDLYRFAFCCSYLHHLALPAYLSRYGFNPNCGEFIFDNIMWADALKALKSALFRPRLHRLVLTYDLTQVFPMSWTIPPSERSAFVDSSPSATLRRLLDLADIDEVHLQLADLAVKSRAEDHLSAGETPYDVETHHDMLLLMIKELGTAWTDILDGFLFKAKCRHLTFELVIHQRPTTLTNIEDTIIRKFYGVNAILAAGRRLAWKTIEAPSRWLGIRTSRLERFHVRSEALFHPMFIDWTIRTLNLSTVTSVAFDQLHHFTPQTWSLLLPCITIPNLLHLSISLCAIHSEDLFRFLARHPTIQELHFGVNLPQPLSTMPMPKGGGVGARAVARRGESSFLPALRVLSGPPDYLVTLLSSPLHPLPTIETVRVWYRARRASQFTLNAINHDLAPICLRLRSVKEVVLSVSFETSGVDWADGQQHQQHRRASSSASQERLVGFGSEMRNGGAGAGFSGFSQAADEITAPSVSFVSSCVTRVEFNTNVYVLPLSIIYSLPKWFAAFSKMRELSMRTLEHGRVLPGASRSAADGAFELPSHKDVFLHGVNRNCPSVRKIEVDGKEEEIPIARRLRRLS